MCEELEGQGLGGGQSGVKREVIGSRFYRKRKIGEII